MGFSGSLEKMKITAFTKDTFAASSKLSPDGEFTVMINPEKYTHKYGICYNNTQAQGSNGVSPDFNRISTETVNFELVFDGTGVIPSKLPGVLPYTGDGITKQIEQFKKMAFSFNGKIHSPNYLTLAWGKLLFNCRLTTLDITYTLFKPDGTPLRARVTAAFKGYTNQKTLEKEANKTSPDLTHVLTVKSGDLLPLMCYNIYGSSEYYLQVAEVNQLNDFRNLKVGSQIVFPPVAENEE